MQDQPSPRATVERGIERKRGPGGDTYYLASVWSAKDDKRLRHQCGTLAEARLWRSETYAQLRTGKRRAPTKATLAQDAEEWLKGARAGAIRNRSGEPEQQAL